MSERSAQVPGPFGELGTCAGPLDIRFLPGLGGKVTSLRFGARGREWLAPPVRTLKAPAPGQDWGELDCSGWDECLPNIGASPDGTLADHGDVWRLPWEARARPASLSGWVAPPLRGYRFSRDIQADGGLLRVGYQLENLGEQPLAWAWAQHMLLAADERTRIVSSSPMRLRLDSAFLAGTASSGFDWLCPGAAPTTEIRLRGAAGRAAKLWFEPPLPAVVAVVHGDEWLAWRVADSAHPDLGLWVNLGGWGDPPLWQMAVEPAFGARDAPLESYPGLAPLGPGDRCGWHAVIEAGVGASALDRLLAGAPAQKYRFIY